METDIRLNSSQKSGNQILGVIAKHRAERLIEELLNTDFPGFAGDVKSWQRFFRRFPEMTAGFKRFEQQMQMARNVAEYLRKGWDSPDLRGFEWYAWRAQDEHAYKLFEAQHGFPRLNGPSDRGLTDTEILNRPEIAESEGPPAEISTVEAIAFHLRRSRDRALHCPNPDCSAPYFFRSKKSQKFCSSKCAEPSQRESKRRWWAEKKGRKTH